MSDPSVRSSLTSCKRPDNPASRPSPRSLRWSRRAVAVGQTAVGQTTAHQTVGRVMLGLCCLLLAVIPANALKKDVELEDIFNPLLGVEYSHWLVGPIYQMASQNEVKTYLDLVTDEEAAAFIEAFWQERNKDTVVFQDTPQDIFEQRTVEAEKRYSENAFPGQRTDRGTVYILYGEPESVTFESPRKVWDRTVEVWKYTKGAEPGLDGQRPKKPFRFVEIDGSTVFYTGQAQDPHERVRRRNKSRF